MAMMEQTPRQVAVKISPEGVRLITSGAHYLHMSKKDLVEAAVAFYLDARREEMAMNSTRGCLLRHARTSRSPRGTDLVQHHGPRRRSQVPRSAVMSPSRSGDRGGQRRHGAVGSK